MCVCVCGWVGGWDYGCCGGYMSVLFNFHFFSIYVIYKKTPNAVCDDDQLVQIYNGKRTSAVIWAEGQAHYDSGDVSRLICDRQSGNNFL